MKIKEVYHSIIFSVGEIREKLYVTLKKKIKYWKNIQHYGKILKATDIT